MKSWYRLFSFDNYAKLKQILLRISISSGSNKPSKSTKTTKLIVASTSLLSTSAYFYYNYLNSNESVLAKTSKFKYGDDVLAKKRKECNRLIRRYKEEYGIPGVIVGVSQNGKVIYSKGFGYSDVENNVRANPRTVVRIASISKPITCTLAARLYQEGKLDLDKPINYYIADLPSLKWNNQEFRLTTRQLMSHTSGIRHYSKFKSNDDKKITSAENNEDDVGNDKSYKNIYEIQPSSGDSLFSEFFLNKPFKTTRDALNIFINDDLMFEPTKGYLYSTYGYTLLSAVLEKANGKNSKFSDMLTDLFKKLEMNETYLDYNTPLVTYRSKYYLRNEKKALVNVPFVDNSYKWAGGGILSTVGDLIKYGNSLLKSYQGKDDTYLNESTIKSQVWSAQSQPPKDDCPYGLGWHIKLDYNKKLKYVYHTGGAVGSTTCLLIVPTDTNDEVNGLVVSILCNLQDIREIVKFSLRISDIFIR